MKFVLKYSVLAILFGWCFGCWSNGSFFSSAPGMPNDKPKNGPEAKAPMKAAAVAMTGCRTVAEQLVAVKEEAIVGTVVGIEGKLRINVRLDDEGIMLFYVGAQTSLRTKGFNLPLVNLRLGDRVAIAFRRQDGNNVAQSIVIIRDN